MMMHTEYTDRDFSAAMDARLEGRNRKYHAAWRHFLDFVQVH